MQFDPVGQQTGPDAVMQNGLPSGQRHTPFKHTAPGGQQVSGVPRVPLQTLLLLQHLPPTHTASLEQQTTPEGEVQALVFDGQTHLPFWHTMPSEQQVTPLGVADDPQIRSLGQHLPRTHRVSLGQQTRGIEGGAPQKALPSWQIHTPFLQTWPSEQQIATVPAAVVDRQARLLAQHAPFTQTESGGQQMLPAAVAQKGALLGHTHLLFAHTVPSAQQKKLGVPPTVATQSCTFGQHAPLRHDEALGQQVGWPVDERQSVRPSGHTHVPFWQTWPPEQQMVPTPPTVAPQVDSLGQQTPPMQVASL
jgi:hypothetical protein